MLTKDLELLQATVILFEILQLLYNMCYNTWKILDKTSDCGDDYDAEEGDDNGSPDKQ